MRKQHLQMLACIAMIVTLTTVTEADDAVTWGERKRSQEEDVEVPTMDEVGNPDSQQLDSNSSQQLKNDHQLQFQRRFSDRRRARRDLSAPDPAVVNSVIIALNALGILVSIGSAGFGAIPLILAAILPLYFPGGGDPQLPVWAERSETQRLHMVGIRDTLRQIQRLNAADPAGVVGDVRSLYYNLNTVRCVFMHADNIRSSAAYFAQFASIHLTVNQILILAYSGDRGQLATWQERLDKNVREYVAYARYATQQEAAEYRNLNLESKVAAWLNQLTAARRTELTDREAVLYGRPVAFKRTGYTREWLNCWGAGSECKFRSCPGEDNPMERGSLYEYFFKCRGETFWIMPIVPQPGRGPRPVKTCDRVGIMYKTNWWLTDDSRTSSCAGEHATSMANGACIESAFRINVYGKPCGQPIVERDPVMLWPEHVMTPQEIAEAAEAGAGLSFFRSIVKDSWFAVFRSDVDRDQYYEQLPCMRRPD